MKDIILFLSDQHTQNVIGFENSLVDTPFLDKVSNSGKTFKHCMCNAPLCVPSRMSFLSGQMPSNIGLFNNDTTLPIDVPTIAHALGAQGYKTVLIGRMHFKGDDQLHGFDEHLAQDITSQYWGKVANKDVEYGVFASTTQMKHCQKNVGAGYSPVHAYDDHVTQTALDYIEKKDDQPHFIVIGFYGPHFPYACEKEMYQKYQQRIQEDDSLGLSAHEVYKELQQDSTTKHVAHIKAAYVGMVEMLDERIAKLYEAFQTHQKNETVYIYTSDHGEQCGKRNLFGKQTLYEDALKVPLILWGDSLTHEGIETPVSLLDVSKTILEIGQASLPFHEGHSLLEPQLLKDNIVRVQHCIHHETLKIIEAVYVRNYKLVQLNGEYLLYDLKNDENEINDLSKNHLDVVNELKQYFLNEQEKKALIDHELRQRTNHDILKKWGLVKQPTETARFINPPTACAVAQE